MTRLHRYEQPPVLNPYRDLQSGAQNSSPATSSILVIILALAIVGRLVQ